MTKKEKIAELERKLRNAEDLIAGYESKIERYEAAQEAIPEDCTPGAYCEACTFSSYIPTMVYSGYSYNGVRDHRIVKLRFCMKGACKNFVQKEIPDANKPND